jgi:hypothetical protein
MDGRGVAELAKEAEPVAAEIIRERGVFDHVSNTRFILENVNDAL